MIILDENTGIQQLIDLYNAESEVTSGEFADYIVNNFSKIFDEGQDKFLAMICIQKFRSYDWDESYGAEITSAINWIYSKQDGFYINEFQDYVFGLCPNTFIPEGIRLGYENENGSLFLDAGIRYASDCRTKQKGFKMTKFNLSQLFQTSKGITLIKNNQTLFLSMVIYILITVAAVAIIDVHKQDKQIAYYEYYMDEQEAELQSVVNDKFILQRTLNEVLEDSRMLQELQQVRK